MTDQLCVAVVGPVDLVVLRRLQASAPTDGLVGGNTGAVALPTLIAALARAGVTVTSVTTSELARTTTRESLGDACDVVVVPRRIDGGGRDFRRAERAQLTGVLDRLDVDIVHAHWTYEYALAALRSRHRPVLVSVRDWAPAVFHHGRNPYNVARIASQLWVTRRTPYLTANSPYIQQRLRRLGRKSFLLPNPIAGARFADVSASSWRRRPARIVAVNHGFSGHKNVKTLLRSFRLVRRSLPEARLVLIGNGYETDGRASRWAVAHDLAHNVEFAGALSAAAVDEQMAAARVFVHPSLEESFGTVVVEAMAAGLPVIGGERSGAVPWVVGDAGILCDVADHEVVADALLRVLGSESLQVDLAHRGQRNAWSRFHEDTVARTAAEIYHRVLDEHAGAA